MQEKSILLPYNFTPHDRKALDFVIECMSPETNRITLFHGYPPLPAITPNDASVMGKLKANMSYLNQKISELENALNGVREELVATGFHQSRVKVIFKPRKKEIANDIIELAHQHRYDVIVLNRVAKKVSRYFSGSVFHRVITTLTNSAVCVVS